MIGIELFRKNNNDDKVVKLRKELKLVFSKIKEELDDHLESINQNTLEVQSNFEYISRLSNKVDKLTQKIENIELMLKENIKTQKKEELHTLLITREEEEILALLLDSTSKNTLLDYTQIADKLQISSLYAASLVGSLMEKGVPIEKKYSNGVALLELNNEFFEKKLKYNILTMN